MDVKTMHRPAGSGDTEAAAQEDATQTEGNPGQAPDTAAELAFLKSELSRRDGEIKKLRSESAEKRTRAKKALAEQEQWAEAYKNSEAELSDLREKLAQANASAERWQEYEAAQAQALAAVEDQLPAFMRRAVKNVSPVEAMEIFREWQSENAAKPVAPTDPEIDHGAPTASAGTAPDFEALRGERKLGETLAANIKSRPKVKLSF